MLNYNEFIVESIKNNPLIQAAKRGNQNKIKELIRQGANLDSRDEKEITALMYATLYRFLSIVDILIKSGANVNLTDSSNRTALMMASTTKIIDRLLNAGADVNIQNVNGNTVIMDYLFYDFTLDQFIEYLNKFLQNGLDLDIKNNDGLNFYDLIKLQQNSFGGKRYIYFELEKYMNQNFPKYKEEWDFKKDVEKYNV